MTNNFSQYIYSEFTSMIFSPLGLTYRVTGDNACEVTDKMAFTAQILLGADAVLYLSVIVTIIVLGMNYGIFDTILLATPQNKKIDPRVPKAKYLTDAVIPP